MVFLEPLLQCFAGRQGVQLGKEGWLQKSLQLNEGHISFRAGLVFIIFFFNLLEQCFQGSLISAMEK